MSKKNGEHEVTSSKADASEKQRLVKDESKAKLGEEVSGKPGGVYHPDNLKIIQNAENSSAQASDGSLYPSKSKAGANESSKQVTFSADGPYNNQGYYNQKPGFLDHFSYLGTDLNNFGQFLTGKQSTNPAHRFSSYTSDAVVTGAMLGAIATAEIPVLMPVGAAAGALWGFELEAAASRFKYTGMQLSKQLHQQHEQAEANREKLNQAIRRGRIYHHGE